MKRRPRFRLDAENTVFRGKIRSLGDVAVYSCCIGFKE